MTRPFRLFFFSLVVLLAGCDQAGYLSEDGGEDGLDTEERLAEPILPDEFFPYTSFMVPPFVRDQADREDNTPFTNRVTDEGATLGRVLFYDKQLSANGTVACASCHDQAFGFADARPFSTGFEGGATDRNAMSVANVRFYRSGRMFWDERAATLEQQALEPIQHPVEMGLTLAEAVTRVQERSFYPSLFAAAFGDPGVTTDRIAGAIAQFERSMFTFSSPFDEARQGIGGNLGQPLAGFSNQQNQGMQLFFSNRTECGDCHSGPLLIGDRPRNNGLDASTTADQGAGQGRFKAPSLRNIGLTSPYMHDGRFETLEDVVEHYNSGVQDHPNLDNRLQRGGRPVRMNLSRDEVGALVAFMETLSDPTLATAERFSDPFLAQ